MSVLAILALPLAAALLCCVPWGRRWAPAVTVLASSATLVFAVRVAGAVSHGGVAAARFQVGVLRWISADGLSALIVLLIAFVGTTASIFSAGYLEREALSPAKRRLYYINYNLFVFSMLAIPLLTEPTLVWIVVELTTLCSALLVSFENTHDALEAAWKYVILSLMGAGFALFGFLVLFAAMEAAGGGVYTWSGLTAAAPRMPAVLLEAAFALILIGLGTKSGLVPMHTWLPDAHSQAPSPVCALLSGVETTAILYVVLRLFPVMRAVPQAHAETWAMTLGLFSVGTAAFLLLQVRDYKRMFAFSTVEHMGVILAAVGIGGSANAYPAMQQIVSHAVTKSFCFFAAGSALLVVETRTIASVRGLLRQSPLAGSALVLGALGIAGAPPLAVFLSEFSILRSGVSQGRYVATGLLALFIVIAFFGILVRVDRMVFGPDRTNGAAPAHRRKLPVLCRLTLLVAAVPVVALGVCTPEPLHRLMLAAAHALAP